MSGISSVASSSSSTYYSPLDTNQDGVVDASELEAAAKSGLLPASITADEDSDDTTDTSATDKFSDSLAGMLLQQMQQSEATSSTDTDSSSTSSDGASSQPSLESLFKSLDANGDGEVSSDEFVAGRPADMSQTDAQSLFSTIDTENTGMLNEGQFSQGVNDLNSAAASSASLSGTSTTASTDPLEAFLTEMQASLTAYQNTYGQYDVATTSSQDAAA
jgi:Ca2+-binding EF-hand superfamily protein